MVPAGRTVANPQQNPADGSAAELPHGSDYSWPRFSNPTSSVEWLGAESNRRHVDFQSTALPTELPSRDRRRIARRREVFTMQQSANTARPCAIGTIKFSASTHELIIVLVVVLILERHRRGC
jgi:hypothetical protein